MRRVLLLTLLLAAVLAPAAYAGEPFSVGEGRDPHLFVDSAGTAHVVWHDETTNIFYCEAPRGATSCTPQTIDAVSEPDETFILSPDDGATLFIVTPNSAEDKTFLWKSTNGGDTWGARTQIYKFGGGTFAGEPFLGPQAGEATFTASDGSVWSAKLDGSESSAADHVDLTDDFSFDFAAAPVGDGGIVAAGNDLNNLASFHMNSGGDPSEPSDWSGKTDIGPGGDSRLAGGAGGAYLLATNQDGAGGQEDIRRFTGGGPFGSPAAIGELGFINDIFESPVQHVAALWRLNDPNGNRLRLGLSTDSGATFAVRTIAIEDAVMASMDVALAGDDQGWAVYEGKGGSNGARNIIRVVNTDTVNDSPPTTTPPTTTPPTTTPPTTTPPTTTPPKSMTKSTSANVGGAKLTFELPVCIPKSGKFTAKLKVKRFPKKGKFRNVKRVDFFVGKKRVKRDKKPPFVQGITIKNPVVGKIYKLKTKAVIKRRGKRKLQRRSLTVKLGVCA